MSKRGWLLPLAAAGALALAYGARRRRVWGRLAANVRAYDLPSAGLYDALWASLLGGFYDRVAGEVARAYPTGEILEVGSGPGRLAVRLASAAPALRVTGVDLAPDMVERATRRATAAGVSDRVRFAVGDVGALGFPDSRFDAVVSTLSLHHWPDPGRGLAEIHRVLRHGGDVFIYDLADRVWRPSYSRQALRELVTDGPFGTGTIALIDWPGPIRAFCRVHLRRGARPAPR